MRTGLKVLFDHAAVASKPTTSGGAPVELPLEKLHTDGFDVESIWTELELQHGPLLKALQSKLRKLEKAKQLELPEPTPRASKKKRARAEPAAEPASRKSKKAAKAAHEEEEEEEGAARARRRMEAFDEEGEEEEGAQVGSREDLAAFLDEGDAALVRMQGGRASQAGRNGEDSEGEEEEEEFDLHTALPEEGGEEAGGRGKNGKKARLAALLSKGVRYADLYGGGEGMEGEEEEGGEEVEGDAYGEEGEDEADAFMDSGMGEGGILEEEEEDDGEGEEGGEGEGLDGEGEDDAMDEDGDDHEEGADGAAPSVPKSKHEASRAKKAAEIAGLEAEALGAKPWWMLGEVPAASRPANSLLSADLDVQQAVRSAPAPTVETTLALEDLIKQRIADAAFDDPVRKAAREASATEKRAAALPELSTEKAPGGLAEVYAAEYAAKVLGANPTADKTSAAEAAAEAALVKLLHKLDALSNWLYAPKPAPLPDMSVSRASLPALTMEEALPTAFSAASVRAPQETYALASGRAGVLRSRGEKAGGEREADRRAAKAASRKDARRREAEDKAVARANPGLGNKYAKAKVMGEIEELRRAGKVVGGGGKTGSRDVDASARPKDGLKGGQEFSGAAASAGAGSSGAGSSSAAFFAQLADEARAKIGRAAPGEGKDKARSGAAAARFKL